MVRAHIHASGKGRGGGAKTTRRLGDNSSSAVRPSWPEFPTASRATCPAGPGMRGIGHRVRLKRESGSFRGGRRGFGRAVFPASFCILRGCGCPLAGRAARFPGGGYTLLWDVARAAASLCRCVPVSLCRCPWRAPSGRARPRWAPFRLPSSLFCLPRLPTSVFLTPHARDPPRSLARAPRDRNHERAGEAYQEGRDRRKVRHPLWVQSEEAD